MVRRDRPPYFHIGNDGQGLTHDPAYTTIETWLRPSPIGSPNGLPHLCQ
ncbi:hypothetical protein [Streptomyces sp. NPDC002078]